MVSYVSNNGNPRIPPWAARKIEKAPRFTLGSREPNVNAEINYNHPSRCSNILPMGKVSATGNYYLINNFRVTTYNLADLFATLGYA